MLKHIVLSICSLMLGGCITYVNMPHIERRFVHPVVVPKPIVVENCIGFTLPKLPDLPNIPELSDGILKDRHLTGDALLHIITEHRSVTKRTREIIEERYREYQKQCGK